MNKKYTLVSLVSFLAIIFTHPVFANTASLNITYPLNGVSIEAGMPQTIKWTSSSYPKEAGVNINLLRQTSFSPNKFEFVRTISRDTLNDGEEVWTPSDEDKGDNLVIQITCSGSFVFNDGCSSSNGNSQISVLDNKSNQSYLASILLSINETLGKIFDFTVSVLHFK